MDSPVQEQPAPAQRYAALNKGCIWAVSGGAALPKRSCCAAFLLIFFLPMDQPRFENAVLEGLRLTLWHAREHVILCLLPAFVIAAAMAFKASEP